MPSIFHVDKDISFISKRERRSSPLSPVIVFTLFATSASSVFSGAVRQKEQFYNFLIIVPLRPSPRGHGETAANLAFGTGNGGFARRAEIHFAI